MPLRYVLLGALALFSAACGGTSKDDPADQSLWPSNATQLKFVNGGGGLVAPPPAGSECQDGGAGSFTVTVADRKLSWESCAYQAPGGNQQLVGSRTLSPDELQSVIAAVKSVTLSTSTSCGADKPSEALEITSPAGTKEYLDEFYACDMAGVYISNIDAVASVLQKLAFPTP
ncbi:MAG: hypothetical protein ABJB12_11755 [Pseudomonadota bacterium]